MKNYLPFWLIIFVSFVIIFALSAFDEISIGSYKPKSSGMYDNLTRQRSINDVLPAEEKAISDCTAVAQQPVPVDTASKVILFIGDSMLDGLSPRLAAYAEQNGHTLYTVIWYSSTSERWGKSDKLASYIKRIKPGYIFLCLGANELSVRDIIAKRDAYVKKIISDIGDIPYVWIGPPNWKEDTGINRLIATNTATGCYFKSDGMTFERGKDGAHPTRSSAAEWMDSVARWMPLHCSHPIKMELPESDFARPARVYVHQPDEN